MTPTDKPAFRIKGINLFIKELFPAPGGPVIPILSDSCESLKIYSETCFLEKILFSIPDINSEIEIKSFFFALSAISLRFFDDIA